MSWSNLCSPSNNTESKRVNKRNNGHKEEHGRRIRWMGPFSLPPVILRVWLGQSLIRTVVPGNCQKPNFHVLSSGLAIQWLDKRLTILLSSQWKSQILFWCMTNYLQQSVTISYVSFFKSICARKRTEEKCVHACQDLIITSFMWLLTRTT